MTARELAEKVGTPSERDDGTHWFGSGVLPSVSEIGEGGHTLDRGLAGAVEVDEWADWPYRRVWRVDGELALVTYCEGDVSVVIARSPEGYEALRESAQAFYATH